MRDVPATMTAAWQSGVFVGDTRPTARVTVQHCHMRLQKYTLSATHSRLSTIIPTLPVVRPPVGAQPPPKAELVDQIYGSFLFANPTTPKELPNVLKVNWTRSVHADVAECTITLQNTRALSEGLSATHGDFELPGWYSPLRGGSSFSNRWGHTTNEWFGLLMPDNVVRTYQGYGTDGPETAPERDSHLVKTGVWLIDRVVESAAGLTMTLYCRDLGRLLMEQSVYPPVVPTAFYPLSFSNWDGKVRIGGTEVRKTQMKIGAIRSSNAVWTSGPISGHLPADAFDGKSATYWKSWGIDRPGRKAAFEWIECDAHGKISEVHVGTRKKGYIVYLSLKVGGVWIGHSTVPYQHEDRPDNGAAIKYYKSMICKPSDAWVKFSFPGIAGVEAVRVTLGNMQVFSSPGEHRYRAAINEIKVFGDTVVATSREVPAPTGPAGANPGKIKDYTDVIKLVAAWAGFLWPDDGYIRYSDGTENAISPASNDFGVLGAGVLGTIWGDLETTGTAPIIQITPDNFDKKSLMEVVSYIRDIVGFYFGIDESGAIQWRMPNLFNLGNMRTGLSANPGRTKQMIVIDESKHLMGADVTANSQNVREGIWVGDIAGRFATIRPGWNPNPTGMRRMSGWTDQNFASVEESRMMADMISLRQLMTYRTTQLTIPANPAIQVDDQVRVFERTSSEGFVHYVQSITSDFDNATGQWTYAMDTNWLGQDPDSKWIFKTSSLGEEAGAHVLAIINSPFAPAPRGGF